MLKGSKSMEQRQRRGEKQVTKKAIREKKETKWKRGGEKKEKKEGQICRETKKEGKKKGNNGHSFENFKNLMMWKKFLIVGDCQNKG